LDKHGRRHALVDSLAVWHKKLSLKAKLESLSSCFIIKR